MRVLVDWENLRIGLHCRGWVADPLTVLSCTNEALDASLGPSWRSGSTIELFFRRGFETRADAKALAARREPRVRIGEVDPGKDMADFEIALTAVEQVFGPSSVDIWVLSSDADLARLVQRLGVVARRAAVPGVIGLLPHLKTPGLAGDERRWGPQPVVSIRDPLVASLTAAVGPVLKRRSCTSWDRAAWVFRRRMAERFMGPGVLESMLNHGHEGGSHADWRRVTGARLDDTDAELVDGAVARLWRMTWGEPFPPAHARARLVEFLPDLGPRNVDDVLNALLLSGMIRFRGVDQVEVPSAWREGFLYPTRRLALFVVSRHRVERRKASDRHAKTIVRRLDREPSSGDTEDKEEKDDNNDNDDVEESFHIVVRALKDAKALTELQKVFSVDRTHPFVADTIATAKRVLAQLESPCLQDEAERRVAALGLRDGKRWLRLLLDTSLAERPSDKRWRVGQLARQPPWSDL